MAYRTILGVVLQALQQLTGANFSFYYGTTVFVATGLSNSFVTQIILGTFSVVCTFPGFGSLTALVVGSVSCWVVLGCVSNTLSTESLTWLILP